jgi:putative ABC transport system substrate-binding protein
MYAVPLNRRAFIARAAALAAAAPLASLAQQKAVRIAWLSRGDRSDNSPFFDSLRGGLRDLGYVEGRNMVLEQVWTSGTDERAVQMAAELMRSRPDIVFAQGSAARLLIKDASGIPVVFGYSGDPVEAGLADSLARPGRNLTGMSFLTLDLVGKRMELLKEALPSVRRVAIIANPGHIGERKEFEASMEAARKLGLTLQYHPTPNTAALDQALAGITREQTDAVLAFPDTFTMDNRQRVVAAALKARLPSISGWEPFAEAGMLLSYGPNLKDTYRRLAAYVDRVLKGTAPAALPVELPTTIEFVVNQRTARAIGIRIPRSVLLRADRVIE